VFYHIEGTVTDLDENVAVLDCSGVGYKINTTTTTLSRLKIGERAKLYTYLYIREDCFDLYGFYSLSEKRLFEMLINVSGVGPKAGLSLLSLGTPESLAMAIIEGNEKTLTVAHGIGKKTAQRVILELKDRIAKEITGNILNMPAAGTGTVSRSGGKLSDAAAALAVLGYDNSEIAFALKDIDTENRSLEEIIRQALRKMVK
jgi:Holliday junction DNA helicase RuvA